MATVPSKRNRRQSAPPAGDDAARRRLLAAARRRFLGLGFRSVTMDELADELGMSKKTVYQQFPSKAALLEAVVLDKFGELQAELAEIVSESSADFPTCLHRLLECLHRHTDEIKPPFVRDVQREAPALFEIIRSKRRDLIQRSLGEIFSQGCRQGLIRNDIAIPLMIEILLGAVDGIMNPAKVTELDLTPLSAFSAIIRVILEGVLTPRGRAR
jgi:AcrR family transcriptional regulator